MTDNQPLCWLIAREHTYELTDNQSLCWLIVREHTYESTDNRVIIYVIILSENIIYYNSVGVELHMAW